MRRLGQAPGGAVKLEIERDELVLLFGCMVEALEALSPDEFRARIGQPWAAVEALLPEFREMIRDIDGA